jgi:hypothetical protein
VDRRGERGRATAFALTLLVQWNVHDDCVATTLVLNDTWSMHKVALLC